MLSIRVLTAQIEPPDIEPVEIDAPEEIAPWLGAIGLLLVGLVLARLGGRLIRRVLLRTGVEFSLALLLSRVVSWLGAGLALFYALSFLGVQLGPVLGALGLTGLVVALALQSLFEDVFAGLILQARRPFYIGDEVETQQYRGRVTDITSRAVRIRTFSGEDLFLPNSEVLGSAIVNQTRPGSRRLNVGVGVAYGTDLDQACKVVEEAVRNIHGVRDTPAPPRCFVLEFAESSVNLELMIWHDPPELTMWRIRSEAVSAIHRAFSEAGITIPFPQRTLWIPQQPSGERPDE